MKLKFFWAGDLTGACSLSTECGKRAFFYGITIGEFGFGLVVRRKK